MAMFQSLSRAAARWMIWPAASRRVARMGVAPKLVRLTTRSVASAKGKVAGSGTARGMPGWSCLAERVRV